MDGIYQNHSLVAYGVPEWAINRDPAADIDWSKPNPKHILNPPPESDEPDTPANNSAKPTKPNKRGELPGDLPGN